ARTSLPLLTENAASPGGRLAVLLVNCLPADPDAGGDLLPRPALLPSLGDVPGFEPLRQFAQGTDGAQADRRVGAAGLVGQLGPFAHECQCRLTPSGCQPELTRGRPSRARRHRLGVRYDAQPLAP